LLLILFAAAPVPIDVAGEVARQECSSSRGAPDEVVVCGQRGRDERYRLPGRTVPFDPAGNVESVGRERMRWGQGGESGIQSCGPVGPGGWTGCMVQDWKRQDAQTQWGRNVPKERWRSWTPR